MQVHVNPMPKTRFNDLMIRDPRLEAWSTIGPIDHRITWTVQGPRSVFAELRGVVAEEQRIERAKEAERVDARTAGEAETTGSACGTEER